MEENNVIKSEAAEYYENSNLMDPYTDSHIVLQDLKNRLGDFYTVDHKAVFLDELEKMIQANLLDHRKSSHGGKADPECYEEKNVEKILFYIRQEMGTLPIIVRQKFVAEAEERNKVFISYSHKDKDYLNDIKRHFKPFLKHIDFWDDTQIQPGQKWKDEIRNAISKTKVAILLLSTDFLGSDFIATDEIPHLLEAAEKEGAVILMLILRPCLFEEIHELNDYQALNAPDHPVSKMDNNEKEELFVNLVRQTIKVLKI